MEIEYCLFRLGTRTLLFFMGIILYIVYVIRKKDFLTTLFYKKDFGKVYQGKNDLIFFRIVNIVLIVMMIIICAFLIKVTMDIPYIINRNYLHLEGYTVGDSKGGANVSSERRAVFVKDKKTGKEIEITIFSSYIEDNTYVKMDYLPYTRYGAIIKK